MQIIVGLALAILVGGAASAHPGDHSGFTVMGLLGHIVEPDHLVFIALIVITGLLAFRAGKRAERRAHGRDRP